MADRNARSLPWLLAAQTQVAFNDNSAKFALMGLAAFPLILQPGRVDMTVNAVAFMLTIAFVLCAPTCGWLADRYAKRTIMHISLWMQVGIMVFIFLGAALQMFSILLMGYFLLAVQSSLFSPAKQGVLKELVGHERLGVAVGWMQMLTILAILAGTLAGGQLFDLFTEWAGNDPWFGNLLSMGLYTLGAILALLLLQPMVKTPARMQEPFRWSIVFSHGRQLRDLWAVPDLRLSSFGVAYFYFLGGIFMLTLVQLGRELFGGEVGTAGTAALMSGALGLGFALGSFSAGFMCRGRIRLSVAFAGLVAMNPVLIGLFLLTPSSNLFYFTLILLGIFAAWFLVPMMTFLQDRADDAHRGRILAAANLQTNLVGSAAAVFQLLLNQVFWLRAQEQFLFMVIPNALVLTAFLIVWFRGTVRGDPG